MTPETFDTLRSNAHQAATLLKAMGHVNRLMILCLLQQGEMSVSELNHSVPIPQSSLSQHLAYLRENKLVKIRRDAKNIYYSLNLAEVNDIIAVLHKHYCQLDKD